MNIHQCTAFILSLWADMGDAESNLPVLSFYIKKREELVREILDKVANNGDLSLSEKKIATELAEELLYCTEIEEIKEKIGA